MAYWEDTSINISWLMGKLKRNLYKGVVHGGFI